MAHYKVNTEAERRSTQSREIEDDIIRIKVVRNELDTRRSRLATRSEYSDKLASNRTTGSYVAEMIKLRRKRGGEAVISKGD
jgi:hypothetical protein